MYEGFPRSLREAICRDSESFLKGVVRDHQTKIKDFDSFVKAFNSTFSTPQGKGATKWMSTDEYRFLFNQNIIRDIVKDNNPEDYEEIYKSVEGHLQGAPLEPKLAKKGVAKPRATPKKIVVPDYERAGKKVSGYKRSRNVWEGAHLKAIKTWKGQGMKPKSIHQMFRDQFPKKPRTYESIRKKYYRL